MFLLLLASFAICLALDLANNDFSYHFNSDEYDKIEQVRTGEYNFHHPMLNLRAARVLWTIDGAPDDRHRIALIGRTSNAILAALGVALLAAAAWVAAGWAAALVVAGVLPFLPALVINAHIFKEESALVFGLGAWALGAACFAESPRRGRALAWGAAAGLALSAKYVLGLALLAGLPALFFLRDERKPRVMARFVAFAVGALLVFALVNAPMIASPEQGLASIGREVDLLENSRGERDGFGRLGAILEEPSELYSILAPLALVFFLVEGARSRRWALPLSLGVFGMAYVAAIASTPKFAARYILPWEVTAVVLVGLLAGRLLSRGEEPKSAPSKARVALLALFVLAQAFYFGSKSWEITGLLEAGPKRIAIFDFVREELPADAVVGYTSKVGLPDAGYPQQYAGEIDFLPQQVRFVGKLYEKGKTERLVTEGITHLVIPVRTRYERDHLDRCSRRLFETSAIDSESFFRRDLELREFFACDARGELASPPDAS